MNKIKYKKGDYVRCEAIDSKRVYILKLLEDSYEDISMGNVIIRAQVKVISSNLYNQLEENYIYPLYILEGEYYTSKKVNYMNTALYKVLYGDNYE